MNAPARPRSPWIMSRGMKIPKHPHLTTGATRGALREGRYERRECDAAMRVVRDGDTVLELGGGLGYMSTLVATKRKIAQVHTYEANPHLIDYIRSVHAANDVGNASVHNILLAPEDGPPRPFYLRDNFLASSMDRDSDPDNVTATAEVRVARLQGVLDDLRPDVLICDIEGAEAELLPAGDFSGLRAAIIELHPQWIGQRGVQAVFDTMQRAGLTYFPKASEAKVVTFRADW